MGRPCVPGLGGGDGEKATAGAGQSRLEANQHWVLPGAHTVSLQPLRKVRQASPNLGPPMVTRQNSLGQSHLSPGDYVSHTVNHMPSRVSISAEDRQEAAPGTILFHLTSPALPTPSLRVTCLRSPPPPRPVLHLSPVIFCPLLLAMSPSGPVPFSSPRPVPFSSPGPLLLALCPSPRPIPFS